MFFWCAQGLSSNMECTQLIAHVGCILRFGCVWIIANWIGEMEEAEFCR